MHRSLMFSPRAVPEPLLRLLLAVLLLPVRELRIRIREAFTLCRCTHPAALHTHYRRGTDCAACLCNSWRRELFRGWKIS